MFLCFHNAAHNPFQTVLLKQRHSDLLQRLANNETVPLNCDVNTPKQPIQVGQHAPCFLGSISDFFFLLLYSSFKGYFLCPLQLSFSILQGRVHCGKDLLWKHQVQRHSLPIVCDILSYKVKQESLSLAVGYQRLGNESKPTRSQRADCTSDCESHHQAKYSIRPVGKASCFSEVGLDLCSAQHTHLEREDQIAHNITAKTLEHKGVTSASCCAHSPRVASVWMRQGRGYSLQYPQTS